MTVRYSARLVMNGKKHFPLKRNMIRQKKGQNNKMKVEMGPTITHILFWTQLIIRKQNKQYVLGISQLSTYTLFMLTFVLVLLFYWPVVLNSCIHWYFSLFLSFTIKLIKIVQQRFTANFKWNVINLFSLLLIISVVWVIDLEILRSYDHCS